MDLTDQRINKTGPFTITLISVEVQSIRRVFTIYILSISVKYCDIKIRNTLKTNAKQCSFKLAKLFLSK